MIHFPLPNGNVLLIIEPGNIAKLKEGYPLLVNGNAVAYTPDPQHFLSILGITDPMPGPNERIYRDIKATPEQIQAALDACKGRKEVYR